jgi:hypothetical protein
VEKSRKTMLNQAFTCAATLTLALSAIGAGWAQVAVEISVDKRYLLAAFAACMIPQLWLALVGSPATLISSTVLIKTVLFPSTGKQPFATVRSSRADEGELKILLWPTTTKTRSGQRPPPCHNSDARLYGGSPYRLSAHGPLCQSRHHHV